MVPNLWSPTIPPFFFSFLLFIFILLFLYLSIHWRQIGTMWPLFLFTVNNTIMHKFSFFSSTDLRIKLLFISLILLIFLLPWVNSLATVSFSFPLLILNYIFQSSTFYWEFILHIYKILCRYTLCASWLELHYLLILDRCNNHYKNHKPRTGIDIKVQIGQNMAITFPFSIVSFDMTSWHSAYELHITDELEQSKMKFIRNNV